MWHRMLLNERPVVTFAEYMTNAFEPAAVVAASAGQSPSAAMDTTSAPDIKPTARYVNAEDLGIVLRLLRELREQTLSRKSFDDATRVIAQISARQC